MTAKLKPSANDERRAFEFATRLATCTERGELNAQIRNLPGLIGAESAIFGGELRRDAGHVGGLSMTAESSDPSIYDEQVTAAAGRLWKQQPVIVRQLRGFIRRPEKISDFISRTEWRRREIYDEVYRPMGMSHELATHLSWSTGRVECVALHRSGRDFGERERELLGLVTPHLRAARERVALSERFAARIALIERGFESLGNDLLVVDHRNEVIPTTVPGALATLHGWFGNPDAATTRLPPEVSDWLDGERDATEPRPLVRVQGTRRLRLRLVRAQEEILIAIEQHEREAPSSDHLAAALPLTIRQAEVLALIVCGRTDTQIATELGISPHTTRRHVEHIYANLGVGNRAAATAAALSAMTAAGW